MKTGFISSILDNKTFEQVIDTAADMGYDCVELACWPAGKAERRYAGVSHIDTENLDDAKVKYILDYCRKKQASHLRSGLLSESHVSGPEKARRKYRPPEKSDIRCKKTRCRHGHDIYRSRPAKKCNRKSPN